MVFAVSRHTGRSLTESTGVPASRVRWLPNTLSPGFEKETDRSETGGSDDTVGLLSVARLWADEGRKGIDHTIEAVARLSAREPKLRYTIIGKGEDKPRLAGLAESLGVADRVDFRQDLTDEELAEQYRRCSIFVLPSGQEGFGIVFLEAMRFSKPCIGGNEGGTPEVIEEGETGFLIPFGDVDTLVQRLETLLADPELRRSMGSAGRRRLLDQFTYERFRGRLADHLEGFFNPS
jgi:glycosyltransferase involved in cell wall biosynthesis